MSVACGPIISMATRVWMGEKKNDPNQSRSLFARFCSRFSSLIFLVQVQCDKKRLHAVKLEAVSYIVVTSRATLAKQEVATTSVRCG